MFDGRFEYPTSMQDDPSILPYLVDENDVPIGANPAYLQWANRPELPVDPLGGIYRVTVPPGLNTFYIHVFDDNAVSTATWGNDTVLLPSNSFGLTAQSQIEIGGVAQTVFYTSLIRIEAGWNATVEAIAPDADFANNNPGTLTFFFSREGDLP